MIWLDWRLFGNGRGMASPYWDDAFYWLDGHFYQWIGGLGAQLQSHEWFAPKAGTRRRLIGEEFVVFQTRRKGPRVEASWALTQMPSNLDAQNARIAELYERLKSWRHGV